MRNGESELVRGFAYDISETARVCDCRNNRHMNLPWLGGERLALIGFNKDFPVDSVAVPVVERVLGEYPARFKQSNAENSPRS